MESQSKECPCCVSENQLHTSEGSYPIQVSSMNYIEGLGWRCYNCGYTEPNDGR